ncbi:hypothetical protein [Paraglaciecola sp.]|uniref:hypothetical protein n=1 Tax=Paraglaciecola sp. TaxID=1920173 RepID=UPI003EF8FBA1
MEVQSKNTITAGKVLFYAVLFLIVIMGLFVLIMSHMSAPGDLSATTNQYTKADLGTIGDFIGGLLNPILTFTTVCLLVWSIHIQQKELSAATTEFRETKELHRDNLYQEKQLSLVNRINANWDLLINSVQQLYHTKQITVFGSQLVSIEQLLLVHVTESPAHKGHNPNFLLKNIAPITRVTIVSIKCYEAILNELVTIRQYNLSWDYFNGQFNFIADKLEQISIVLTGFYQLNDPSLDDEKFIELQRITRDVHMLLDSLEPKRYIPNPN